MFGSYPPGEIELATIPGVIGKPGEENEVFAMASGATEGGDGPSDTNTAE